MKINLNLLPIEIDEDITIPSEFYEKTDIVGLNNLHVVGKIFYNLSDEVEINLHLSGSMELRDAITLDVITEPIELEIKQNLEEITSESTYFYEKSKNILDIIEFLWENIVLEVPISKTLATGKSLSGDGWELNKANKEEDINPEFLKLNDIYKGGE